MKTATISELRNSFGRISRWLEAGESVEVTKRGLPFARILPVESPTPRKLKRAPKPDILARLKADFRDNVIPDETYEEVMLVARGEP